MFVNSIAQNNKYNIDTDKIKSYMVKLVNAKDHREEWLMWEKGTLINKPDAFP